MFDQATALAYAFNNLTGGQMTKPAFIGNLIEYRGHQIARTAGGLFVVAHAHFASADEARKHIDIQVDHELVDLLEDCLGPLQYAANKQEQDGDRVGASETISKLRRAQAYLAKRKED